jgi:2'-5' RNA ligase
MESFFQHSGSDSPPVREDYRWYLKPGAGWLTEHLLTPYRELLDNPGLRPVSPESAHITLQTYAPVAELDQQQIADITGAVRSSCANFEPISIKVRRVDLWQSSVVCTVYPASALKRLCEFVMAAAAEVAGPRKTSSLEFYHPHLMLAYCTSPIPNAPLRAWLCDHDIPEPVLAVDEIVLVAERHEGSVITDSNVAVVPLGNAVS